MPPPSKLSNSEDPVPVIPWYDGSEDEDEGDDEDEVRGERLDVSVGQDLGWKFNKMKKQKSSEWFETKLK